METAAAAASSTTADKLTILMDMGFSEAQAKQVIITKNPVNRNR